MTTPGWRKRCIKCGQYNIIDGRKCICEDCLYEARHGKPKDKTDEREEETCMCEVKIWCSIKECDGQLPCKYGMRETIIKEQVSMLSLELQVELFGRKIIKPLP